MKLPPCDLCGKPVTLGHGCLWISEAAAVEKQQALQSNIQEHTEKDEAGFGWVSAAGFTNAPDPEPWRWTHVNCGPQNVYWIAAPRINTVAKALEWTFHLADKAWFEIGPWEDAIRRLHNVPENS